MALEFLVTERSQIPELSRFFETNLGDNPPAHFFEPSFLEWKYFAPRPEWSRPRSLVVREGSEIVAHLGLWPGMLALSSVQLPFVHPIDWFAHPSLPGVGFALMRRGLRSNDIGIVTGGSADSQALLPKLRFQPRGTMAVYSRVVRPLRVWSLDQHAWSLRGTARLLRHAMRAFDPAPVRPPGWVATRVEEPVSELALHAARPQSEPRLRTCRSIESLAYLLRCPHLNGRLFALQSEDGTRGYFMLNFAGGQCRIVDIHVQSASDEHWRSAYILAVLTAMDDERTSEVIAATSVPAIGTLLLGCGLRLRRGKRVFLSDGNARLDSALPLSLQIADSDAFCYAEP